MNCEFTETKSGLAWWTHYDLTYKFAPVKHGVSPHPRYKELTRQALEAIEDDTPFRFREAVPTEHVNIRFYQQHYPDKSFLGQANGPSSLGSFVDLNWARLRKRTLRDWQITTTVTHEMGHVLGLGHSAALVSQMRPNINFWSWVFCGDGFCQSDLDELQALYVRNEMEWK